MIDVPENYGPLMLDDNHFFEVSVTFGDAIPSNSDTPNASEYRGDALISVSSEHKMFSGDTPTVGGAIAGELTLSMFNPSIVIPRQQKIRVWVRVCADDDYSDWIPQGTYFIDTRAKTQNDDDRDILSVHAYDAMLKAEAAYPETTHTWPIKDVAVVSEIASAIGVSVDSRTLTVMTDEYDIQLPATYTMREVLSYIAAMYAGNWVITYENKLLLIPINGIPKDTNLITDEWGNVIMFGEDAISYAAV